MPDKELPEYNSSISATMNTSKSLVYFQVECMLFPEMRDANLILRAVHAKENLVAEYIDKAMVIFNKNTVGPQMYGFSKYFCGAF